MLTFRLSLLSYYSENESVTVYTDLCMDYGQYTKSVFPLLIMKGSGMKATAELPSRAEKAEPDIVFS